MILGVSATNLEEAIKAQYDGADYLGVGAMFQTGTKSDAKIVSKQELIEITKAVSLPIVVIGGINETTIPKFDDCKIDGVAVVSAIVAKTDITEAARQVKRLFFQNRKSVINKNLAIFDLDGTLLESLGVWVEVDKKFFKKRGMALPSDFIDVTMPMSFLETANYVKEKYNFKEEPQILINEWHNLSIEEYTKNITLKSCAKEYLTQLKLSGVKLVVATSLSKELYLPVLKLNRIDKLFDRIFSVNEVGVGKSSGDIYKHAMNQMEETAKTSILFEDIPDAAESGKKLGLTTVGIKDKFNRQTVASLSSICDFLLTIFIMLQMFYPLYKINYCCLSIVK